MTDQTPHTPGSGLPPVRMALRVIGRHGHRGGPHLARAVADARAPKHLASSTRLSRQAAGAAEAAPAAPAPAAAAAYEAPPAFVPGVDRPNDPTLSDFASEFLFGDAGSASSGLTPMSQAEKMSEGDAAKEARLARRRARGALDVSRAAKILEGPGSGAPASAEETLLPDLAAPAGPVPAAAVKVSRTPAEAPKPPNAPIPLPKPPEEPPPAAAIADPPAAPAAAPAGRTPPVVARAPRAETPAAAQPAQPPPAPEAATPPAPATGQRLARAARRAPSAPQSAPSVA